MKKSWIIAVAAILVVVISLVCLGMFKRNTKFDKSIHLAMGYLANQTLEDGRFVYKTSVSPDKNIDSPRYNSLRHAGVLYSMYLCERYLKDYSLHDKRILASKYFIKRYIQPVTDEMYAVVSIPEEENTETEVAKTGGAGLALIALSNLYSEDEIDLKTLTGLGNFILYMQKPDGSFYSKYTIKNTKRDDKFNSLYYPGEAALGLLYLNEVDPSEKWVTGAKKALMYIAMSRKDKGINVPIDQWAAIATRKLFETPDNGLTDKEKIILKYHSKQIADAAIARQIIDKKSKFYGSFGGEMRLCSIATVLEGLSAIYYTVDDKNLKTRIKTALDAGCEFLAKTQVKEGVFAGGVPYSPYWKAKHAPKKFKVIRIDNVQHALSAWIFTSILK